MSYSGRNGYSRGGSRGGSFGSSPKPVEMGKEYEVEISEISKRGDGIARVQGFVIFVEGAKAGQKTKIRITSIGDRFAKAEVV
jgi:predicted RNA-binding protein with TRAM domain